MSRMSAEEQHSKDRRPRRSFTEEFKEGAVRLVLDEGRSLTEVASDLDLTRARISQSFDLMLLAPQVQEEILFLEDSPGKQAVLERDLRPVTRLTLWSEQQRAWRDMLSRQQSTRRTSGHSQAC